MALQLDIFFNTVPVGEAEKELMSQRAGSQNYKVLEFFRMHPGRDFTPFEVAAEIGIPAPITSIRRAINTLTERGWLRKTGNTRAGSYGAANNTWIYASN